MIAITASTLDPTLEKTISGKYEEKRKNGFGAELRKNWPLFLMLLPTIAFFVINNYIPMAGVWLAFTKFSFNKSLFGGKFVGLDNFKFLTQSGILFQITVNTVLYNLVFILLGNVLQILTAIILSQMVGRIFTKISQSIMFFPYFVSYVILGALVYNMFNYEYGFLNTFLKFLHLSPVNVYDNPAVFPVIIVAFYLWKGLGYGVVIYLATILGISKEIYEAADIDGVSIFQKIRYITLPLIKPTFIVLFLYAIGGIMKGQFELFYQMVGQNGLLYSTTDIIDTYVYRSLTSGFDIGMSAAAGLYQSVFGFALILIVNFLVKRKNPDGALF